MADLSPALHAKATAYTQGGHWVLLWGALVSLATCWLVLRSGLLARTEKTVERRRPHRNLAVFACAAVFSLASFVVGLPWSAYSQWWRERGYGLSSQAFGGWLGEQVLQLALSIVVVGLFLVALYALMRRAGRAWWTWGAGLAVLFVVFGAVIAPVAIEPLFNRYTPAPPSPTRDAVVALAKATGTPSDKIYVYNGSKQSNRYTANVSGLGGSARVAMSDVMFSKGADIAEVRGVVGHEMGHYKLGHVFVGALFCERDGGAGLLPGRPIVRAGRAADGLARPDRGVGSRRPARAVSPSSPCWGCWPRRSPTASHAGRRRRPTPSAWSTPTRPTACPRRW